MSSIDYGDVILDLSGLRVFRAVVREGGVTRIRLQMGGRERTA